MTELQELPPGWECKTDVRSGKQYFINHHAKITTWDDPRKRVKSPKHSEMIPLQEMRSTSRSSPLSLRGAKVQDSSLTIPSWCELDEAVGKISAMFPTVSETHIRLLMKNCRYMKSIFPEAEETVILEVLYNNESNIQKTSEILIDMGFQKKDAVKVAQQKVAAKIETAKKEEEECKRREEAKAAPKRVKTAEEKSAITEDLKNKYRDVADHLITIALESVDYDEVRANQILEIMKQEDVDNAPSRKDSCTNEETITELNQELKQETALPVSQSRQSIKSLLKSDKDKDKDKITQSRARSPNKMGSLGPDPGLARGPNTQLLLEDYLNWQGPNSTIRKGSQGLHKGPNRSLLSQRSYEPRGSNPELRKGPKFGLAKGSIFSQFKNATLESRGK